MTTFKLDFPVFNAAGNQHIFSTTCTAHVMRTLRPNMLIGTDFLTSSRITLDFDHLRATFADGSWTAISVNDKPPSFDDELVPVIVRQRTLVMPRSTCFVPVKDMKPLRFPHLFFSPNRQGFMAQILDNSARSVLCLNDTDLPYKIRPGWNVGSLQPCRWDGMSELGDPGMWVSAAFAEEVTPALSLSVPTNAFYIDDSLPKRKGHFETTIGGTEAEFHAINKTVARFQRLFTDDGLKVADIPEEDWMTIPLVSDWNTADAKLAHKVYPLGPKDREVVDATHDKLHAQGRMRWTTEPTPFGFPVFVVWRNTDENKRKGRVVVDIHGLNKVTTTDAYPMPLL